MVKNSTKCCVEVQGRSCFKEIVESIALEACHKWWLTAHGAVGQPGIPASILFVSPGTQRLTICTNIANSCCLSHWIEYRWKRGFRSLPIRSSFSSACTPFSVLSLVELSPNKKWALQYRNWMFSCVPKVVLMASFNSSLYFFMTLARSDITPDRFPRILKKFCSLSSSEYTSDSSCRRFKVVLTSVAAFSTATGVNPHARDPTEVVTCCPTYFLWSRLVPSTCKSKFATRTVCNLHFCENVGLISISSDSTLRW